MQTEILIPRAACGRVIGKGGAKIKELQDCHHVQINIFSKEERDDDCVRILIKGDEPSYIDSARTAIDYITGQDEGVNGRPFPGRSENFPPSNSRYGKMLAERLQNLGVSLREEKPVHATSLSPHKESEEIIYVSKSMCGRIIGSGGSKIRELQENTQTRIQLNQNDVDNCGNIPVTVRGSRDKVAQASQLIQELVNSPSRYERESPQKAAYSSESVFDYKRGYPSSDMNHSPNSAFRQAPPAQQGFLSSEMNSYGGNADFQRAPPSQENYYSSESFSTRNSGPTQYSRYHESNNDNSTDYRQQASSDHQNSYSFDTNSATNMGSRQRGPSAQRSVWIPRRMCGKIIGAGGSKIRELQEQTNTRIKVNSDNCNSAGDVEVTVDGSSSDDVSQALDLINNLTCDDGNDRTRNSRRDVPSAGSSHSMKVPKQKVGKIIGKQGETIRWLQDETLARIKVNSDEGDEATIEISGTQEAIQDAIEKITSIVNEARPGEIAVEEREYDTQKYEVQKNFYHEHPEVSAMSEEEVRRFLKDRNNIMLSSVEMDEHSIYKYDILTPRDPNNRPLERQMPKPVKTFAHAMHPWPDLLAEIKRQPGFVNPSPIQCMLWPSLLSGLDVIGVAQTGTGKTLGFLVPAFIHIEGQIKERKRRAGPSVLVLAPTRELAIQIHQEVEKYSYHGISSVCVYGGVEKVDQVVAYRDKRPEILVGTPGRVHDLVQSKLISLEDVTYVVLDEADRMLDLGFEPQVLKILYFIGTERQTCMTTATWPFALKRVAYKFMVDPIQINVGSMDLNACKDVKQTFIFVERMENQEKESILFDILTGIMRDDATGEELFKADANAIDKAIVFLGRKTDCNYLKDEIMNRVGGQYKAGTIHGDLGQYDREAALDEFRASITRVLVATDIAARGLDIVDVTHVINLDFPRNMEEYVHRVGRTARAGRTGLAITFISSRDWRHAQELIGLLREAGQPVPAKLEDMANAYKRFQDRPPEERQSGFRGRGRGRGGGGGFRGGAPRDRYMDEWLS